MELFESIVAEDNSYNIYRKLAGVVKPFGLKAKTVNTDEGIIITLSAGNSYDTERISNLFYLSIFGNGASFLVKDGLVSPICIPSRHCFRFNPDEMNSVDDYKIHKIIDGSMVNLYYYNDTWKIGTTHTHDARDYYWRGVKYSEEIERLSSKINFDFNTLDTTKTYSLIMASKYMNPTSKRDELVFLSAQNNITFERDLEVDINIPKEETIEYKRESFDTSIKDIDDGVWNFGRVFRNINGGYDYIDRSSLFRNIRNMIYNCPNNVKGQEQIKIIRRNFIYTHFMVLCNIIKGCRQLGKRVPLLQKQIRSVRQITEELVDTGYRIFCGEPSEDEELKDITRQIRDFVNEDAIRGKRDFGDYLLDFYFIEFLYSRVCHLDE